jgi:hypothetical protein
MEQIEELRRMEQIEELRRRAGILQEAGAGVSRIVTHIRKGDPFITISAMKWHIPYRENMKRTEELQQKLHSLPVSSIETEGEYPERQPDGTTRPAIEKSFFVLPKKSHGARIDLDKFLRFGMKLMNDYEQESIGYGDGNEIYLVYSDGHKESIGNAVTFSAANVAKLAGWSRRRGTRFSFTDLDTHSGAVEYNADDNEYVADKPGQIPDLPDRMG